jgi:hypothetical protein
MFMFQHRDDLIGHLPRLRSVVRLWLLQILPHSLILFSADFSPSVTPVENLTGVFFAILSPIPTTHRPARAPEKEQHENDEKDKRKYPHPMKPVPKTVPPHMPPLR